MRLKLILSLLATLLIFGCTQASERTANGGGKIRVVASFYPLYDFAKNVGGDRVEVSTLIPAGIEPHDFEPAPSSIRQLSNADVFIYNGAGMENWVQDILQGISDNGLLVVDTSSNIQLITSPGPGQSGKDPHIWLDPLLAKKQVDAIMEAFIKADPAGKDYYEKNAAAYKEKLDSLDNKIRIELSACNKKDILITHTTLSYFCKEYGCDQIPIVGVNEEGEPSPADLVKIVEQARARNITAVYFETLISPKSAQTIASEINGDVLIFNTIHGLTQEEQARGENYLSLMEENLGNIKKGLDCK